jgi:hypothetical protein
MSQINFRRKSGEIITYAVVLHFSYYQYHLSVGNRTSLKRFSNDGSFNSQLNLKILFSQLLTKR